MNRHENSRVISALSGKRIVLTGTTGFLGKVVLEKLLRTVPDIERIYLIIRGNRHHPCATERFRAEVATSSVFDHLRETRPEALARAFDEKIRCIPGEITQPRFGLEAADYQALAQNADIFINSAASVNFQEALDTALSINARCLEHVADFARDAGDIPVVQVSTCYVNGRNRGDIEERLNPSASGRIEPDGQGGFNIAPVLARLDQIIEQLRGSMDDPEALARALVEAGQKEAHRYGWGDTYTFTKWLGEQILWQRMKDKTLTIVRPSVIESCLKEPVPGWIEGVKVTDAILLAYARNKVSVFPGRKAGIVDIIPADLVANAIILSMAEALTEPGQFRVYQSCSGSRNPLVVRDYVDTICGEVKKNWRKYPKLARSEPRRKFTLINKHLFVGLVQMMRLIVTLVDRTQLRTVANKSRRLQAIETTLKLTKIYSTYTSPDYIFRSDKLMALANRMTEEDRALFPVDAAIIPWRTYFEAIHVTGLNRYGMETRPQAKPEPKAEQPAAVAGEKVAEPA